MAKGLIDILLDKIFDADWVGRHGEKLTERELNLVKLFGRKGKVLRNIYVPKDNGETSETVSYTHLDGATRFQRILHINIPGILDVYKRQADDIRRVKMDRIKAVCKLPVLFHRDPCIFLYPFGAVWDFFPLMYTLHQRVKAPMNKQAIMRI